MQEYNSTNITASNVQNYRRLPYLVALSLKIVGIVTPIIIFLGILGNIFSAMIFLDRRLRKTSCSLYLASRTLSDTGFLLCLFITWLETVEHRSFHVTPMCQIIVFLTYLFGFLSVWFVVFVTAENYVRVCRPFSVNKFCNLKRTRITIITAILLGSLFYSSSLWTNHVVVDPHNRTFCRPNQKFAVIHSVIANGDTVITLVVPSVIMVVLMITITYHILPISRNRNSSAGRQSSHLQAKVTRLLFWVSFFFLLLNIPSHSIRIFMLIRATMLNTQKVTVTEYFIQQMLQLCYYASFAVNFPIYIILGDTFRRSFARKFFSIFRTQRSEYTAVPSQVSQSTRIELRPCTLPRKCESVSFNGRLSIIQEKALDSTCSL